MVDYLIHCMHARRGMRIYSMQRAVCVINPYHYTQKDAHTEIFKNYAEIYEEKILIVLVEHLSFLLF